MSTTTTNAGAVVSFQPTISTVISQIQSSTDQTIPVTTSIAPVSDINTGSQSSVIFGVGVAVGATIALLLAVGVLGMGLLIVWRRKNTSQLDLKPVQAIIVNGNVDHMDNPVYGGEQLYRRVNTNIPLDHLDKMTAGNPVLGNGSAIHSHKFTQQQEAPSRADYEFDDSHPYLMPEKFHNPLYSDAGPPTVSE